MKHIKIYNLGNLPTAPLSDFHELQEDFKITDDEKLEKLIYVIIKRGFKYAFKAWKDSEGKLWIIDAHQRKKALTALQNRGYNIENIPYEPIFAKDKKEAVEEIAAYNSEFGRKNPNTILFEKYDIDEETLDLFTIKLDFDVINFQNSSEYNRSLESFKRKKKIEDIVDDGFVVPSIKTINTKIKIGDIIEIGPHRLVCGDSTNKNHISLLFNGKLARLVLTDPPYNVNYEGKTSDRLKIQNDKMIDSYFRNFLTNSFTHLNEFVEKGGTWYVWHAGTEGLNFMSAMKDSGILLKQCLIWLKDRFVLGRQDYQWIHEPCLYGWKSGAAHKWYGDRSNTTVLKFDRPIINAEHPTMKPVPLFAFLINNSSQENDIVADTFIGSGTTMIACHELGRICYAMDISPQYCDVVISRMKLLDPNLIVKINGNIYK